MQLPVNIHICKKLRISAVFHEHTHNIHFWQTCLRKSKKTIVQEGRGVRERGEQAEEEKEEEVEKKH